MLSRVSFTIAVLVAIAVALVPMRSFGRAAKLGAVLALSVGAGLLFILLRPFDLGPDTTYWSLCASALTAGALNLWMAALWLRLSEMQRQPGYFVSGAWLVWGIFLVNLWLFPDNRPWMAFAVLLTLVAAVVAAWRRWIPVVVPIGLAAALLVWGVWHSSLRTKDEVVRRPVPCSPNGGNGCEEWIGGRGQAFDLAESCRHEGGIAILTSKPGTVECLVQR